MSDTKRKLATILATDCVSFSKHMVQDEIGTLSALKSCRTIIDLIIHEHGGGIFHTAGDSVIAEFPSPVECVTAAVKFQDAIAARNANAETEIKLCWRVGIHVDDVIIEGENVYGNGVNIAARLESQAEPNQILISRIVQEQVSARIESIVRAAGTRVLKNISQDFPVFTVGGEELSPLGLTALDNENSTQLDSPESKEHRSTAVELKEKPKLAVMRFQNKNPNEDSTFLVDGIFEDVITEFSMIRDIEIVSRQSAVNAQENEQSTISFVHEYGINFLVSGSIRTSGNRVRINVELTETNTENVLWSKKFDRTMEDIFDIQDEIVSIISKSILGEIELTSLSRSKRKPTENMSSYEFLLRGKELHHRYSAEASSEALMMFDKAIAADPENGQAYAWKACTLGQRLARGFAPESFEVLFPTFQELIGTGLSLNANDFECHRMVSAVNISLGKYELAIQHGRKAYEIVGNDPRVLSGYGEALLKAGQYGLGLEMTLKALELEPIPQGQVSADKRHDDAIFGHFLNEDYEQCVELFQKVEIPEFRVWLLTAVASDQLSLQFGESQWFRRGQENYANLDLKSAVAKFQLKDEVLVEQLTGHAERLVRA